MAKIIWNKGKTPPKNGKYLVHLGKTEKGDVWNDYNLEIAQYENGVWISNRYPISSLSSYITHWRKLPALPKD